MMYPHPLNVPEIEIDDPILRQAGVRLIVRREDLNSHDISGNKYWKLKYNIVEAHRRALRTVLTFGGAFSNHIAATAAACRLSGLKSIGIIRGEDADLTNNTLAFAIENGMEVHLISRASYREKNSHTFRQQLEEKFGDFYLIPEGGTNSMAIFGVQEMMANIRSTYDVLALPVGTGGTITGCLQALKGRRHVLGFSVLKGDFLANEVQTLHEQLNLPKFKNWEMVNGYHFGGYGKTSNSLVGFIRQFEEDHTIPLDPVYTGKMMYGILQMTESGFFSEGTTVLALHTGGLQGRNPASYPPLSNL